MYTNYILGCSGINIIDIKISVVRCRPKILNFISGTSNGISLYLSSPEVWQYNYAGWPPVHLRIMKSLPIVTRSSEDKFRDGLLVIYKARKKNQDLQ